jgi:WD40 repeat protein
MRAVGRDNSSTTAIPDTSPPGAVARTGRPPAASQLNLGDTLATRQVVEQQQEVVQPQPAGSTQKWVLVSISLEAPLGALDAALSADGKTLAIAATDNLIRILDVSTAFSDAGQAAEVAEIPGHSDLRAAMSLSQDGTKLAIADLDGNLSITNLTFARMVWRLESPFRSLRHATAIHTAMVTSTLPSAGDLSEAPRGASDLYDRPSLAVDPGMHTARLRSMAVDAEGRFAITGGSDSTVRIWSATDGKLLRTVWIPVGPDPVGDIYAVAISPDGSTVAVGGWTERRNAGTVIYLFDRNSGALIGRIDADLPNVVSFLTFSLDGRYLAATVGSNGLRVFDRDKDWREAFRDDRYGDQSYGATFARDGHLATTAYDGLIRLYQYDPNNDSPKFRRVGEPVRAPSGNLPFGAAFSPDGKRLAIGYHDVAAVDVLDGVTLNRVGGQSPANATPSPAGPTHVAWSGDGETLYAAGGVTDQQGRTVLFAWDRGGLGDERRMTYCASDTAAGVDALPEGRILVASLAPCLGLIDARGEPIWTVNSPVLDFRGQTDVMRVSEDGRIVDFGYLGSAAPVLRFDARSLTLSRSPNDGSTFAAQREGLAVKGWRNGMTPTLNGRPVAMQRYDMSRSLAITSDAKRFFVGSSFGLTAFDDTGAQKWWRAGRGEVWATNATKDGRILVAAEDGGAIHWLGADDGRELLALQVLPNRTDWVLWTPEGFYEATSGAQDVLKWVVNRGPDTAATTAPVSAIPKLHRPDALALILDELGTARALGIADLTAARLDVQSATGSAKPPGGVLHVLSIGIDKFGDKAGDLHLDYAAEDAHDVASALLASQKSSAGKASLYADVSLTYLPNDKADNAAILDTLDAMAQGMAKSGADQDLAIIFVSTYGEMIDGQFYLIPYGFDPGSQGRSIESAVSASEFARKVAAIAAHGKVLLLIDASHPGMVAGQAWAKDPDAKVLQDALDLENVTVLTSSRRNELSEELPAWKHGAFAQAFLDALAGAADAQDIVRLSALTDAMEVEVQSLTKGRQHLGMHVNFTGDLFVASHY